MKKRIMIVSFLFLLEVLIFLSLSIAVAEDETAMDWQNGLPIQTGQTGVFILPESLVVIDEEAFSGTKVHSVTIPEHVEEIGDRAFAKNKWLKQVFIFQEKIRIAEDAFSDGKPLLSGFATSYARTWAARNGYGYLLQPSWKIKSIPRYITTKTSTSHHTINRQHHYRRLVNINERQSRPGRSVGEIKSTRYKGVSAIHIQSRFFP